LTAGGIASVVALAAQDSGDAESARWIAPIVGVVGTVLGIFLLALAIPSILGGWGLLKYKSWSRILMIVVSALSLVHFPFGTALGVYGLWVLVNEQSRQLLESGGMLPPPGYPMEQPLQQPAGFPGRQPPQGL
jgi:hypothetical protein